MLQKFDKKFERHNSYRHLACSFVIYTLFCKTVVYKKVVLDWSKPSESFRSTTVDSLYLEHPLSRTSQSLCVSCDLFFSLYLELSLSRTNFLVPCEFEIERVNCILMILYLDFWYARHEFE